MQKRARVGPKLMGKEVLVSDGVAAVLTGVVSAIEDGQARIHYRGRKAKLDEWIDIHSERFLSATEVRCGAIPPPIENPEFCQRPCWFKCFLVCFSSDFFALIFSGMMFCFDY